MDSDFTAARQSWRGATYDQVLMAWGTPSSSGKDSHTWLAPGCDRTLAFRGARVVDENWVGDARVCERYARRTG
jgi:hypothetical protein